MLDGPRIGQEGYRIDSMQVCQIFDQAMLSRANQIVAHITVIACK